MSRNRVDKISAISTGNRVASIMRGRRYDYDKLLHYCRTYGKNPAQLTEQEKQWFLLH